ncbi:MAG: transcriptional regulator [Armatimonadota bacterium]
MWGVVMPKSILLLQMIDLLRERPGLSIDKLAAILGRSERTIYRYLESLSDELHVGIYCEQGGYYLAERPVSSQLDLSPKEVLAVRLALTSNALGKGAPFSDYAVTAWKKIELALTGDSLKEVQSSITDRSIYASQCSQTKASSEVVDCLADSIERSKRISVIYCSQRSGETKSLFIDPYALVFRRHNWYLIAFSHSHGRIIQLKLIRIVKAEKTGENFQLPHDFSVDSFYAKSWEMWTGDEERLVRVKFSPRVARIIKETKRHPSQELQDTPDGGVIFSVKVSGIEEISFWILSWGSNAEVIEPDDLRKLIDENAQKMLSIYSSPTA